LQAEISLKNNFFIVGGNGKGLASIIGEVVSIIHDGFDENPMVNICTKVLEEEVCGDKKVMVIPKNIPIAHQSFYITRYTTTERELLYNVETLKEFRNILLGQQIIVHTDHANPTYKNFNSDRITLPCVTQE
jgi:RNase H-like domain found in reverse transcriptase